MALIVEDGTAKADAESFASVDYADTYHSNRANDAWAVLTTPKKEAALRKSTDYMEEIYRTRWKGVRLTTGQALSWPREFVEREDFYSTSLVPPDSVDGSFYYPSDIVVPEVIRACAELALRASTGDLSPDLDRPTTSETVGPISVTYAVGSRQFVKFRAIENLLEPFLMASGSSMKVVRA